MHAGAALPATALALELAVRPSNVYARGPNNTRDDVAALEDTNFAHVACGQELLGLTAEALAKSAA